MNETDQQPASFSFARVGTILVAIFGITIAIRLPRAMMKLANDSASQTSQVQSTNSSEIEQLQEKIKRGEDVPDAMLILAGINPETYKTAQAELRRRKLEQAGQYSEAVKLLDEALLAQPESLSLLNSQAWLLATCPDEIARNGKRAVELALKLCELSEYENATYLDTLAAAHAEAAEFDEAKKQEESAIELTQDFAQKQRFLSRLELYKNQQPYHAAKATP